jgi:parallel beta-helix repeat protein
VASIPAAAAQDAATNASEGSTSVDNSVLYDEDNPYVVSIVRDDPNPTNAASVSWTVTFSEDVSGVGVADFVTVEGGLVTGSSVTSVLPLTDSTYRVTASTGTGDGTLGLNLVDDDSITDDATNVLEDGLGGANGDFTGEVYDIDKTAPAAPALVAPADTAITTDNTPTLDWTDVSDPSSPVTYTAQIVMHAGPCGTASWGGATTVSGLASSTYTVAPPLANGSYCWRVLARDNAGNDGPYTAPWKFTVDTSDADGDGIPSVVDCTALKDTVIVDPSGTLVLPDFVLGGGQVTPTLQAAVIAAADNGVIAMYGDTVENVVIGTTTGSGNKDLRIIGCGHKVTAANGTLPVIKVQATAGISDGNNGAGEKDIHIDDVNVYGGVQGYLVETSVVGTNQKTTLLKSLRAENNGWGVKVVGTSNEVRGADGIQNNTAGGISVQGASNNLNSNRVGPNTGWGIDVVSGNSQQVKANKVEANTAGGIRVVSSSNVVNENDVYSNGGAGIRIVGNTNQVFKNDVGEEAKGNTGNGIEIVGNSNELGKATSENNLFANTGNGLHVIGDSNKILKNDAGDTGKGNGGDGIHVEGKSNTIQENNVFANGGDGIDARNTAGANTIKLNDVGDRNKGNGYAALADVDAATTGDGIHIVGNGNAITGNDVFHNAEDGVDVAGNTNNVATNTIGDSSKGNGQDGVHVLGTGNTVQSNNVFANGGDGIDVASGSPTTGSNIVKLNKVGDAGVGNGADGNAVTSGDGIHVEGKSNTIDSNVVHANAGDGIEVVGNSNVAINTNTVGSNGKGNLGAGIKITGYGNSLTGNTASANGGNGFEVSGGSSTYPNLLKNSVSNAGSSGSSTENTGAEYSLFNYVKNNAGGNKADNIVVPKTTAPTKCTAFPATNVTANFAAISLCE